jgi:Spy/CpxP family protein refolding chaperone
MNSPAKVKTQVMLLIVLVFVLGGVTGAAVDRMILNRPGSKEKPGPRYGRGLESMTRDLKLTPEQADSIRTIFGENRKEFRTRMSECPGVRELREQTDARIKELLTAEQQTLLEAHKARREAERRAEEK